MVILVIFLAFIVFYIYRMIIMPIQEMRRERERLEQEARFQQERERQEKKRQEKEQKEREQREQERKERERIEKERREQEQRKREQHRERIRAFAELLQQSDELWQQEEEWREKDHQWVQMERRETKRLITALIRMLLFETERRIGLFEIDKMEGHQFEYYCAGLLQKLNFSSVEVTKGSGDQGVDIIAIKDSVRYAIQCKRYSSTLGNSPVQEVNAGKQLYRCHVAVVLTNQYFTPGAKQLASATGVLLWDRDKLEDMIKQVDNISH